MEKTPNLLIGKFYDSTCGPGIFVHSEYDVRTKKKLEKWDRGEKNFAGAKRRGFFLTWLINNGDLLNLCSLSTVTK